LDGCRYTICGYRGILSATQMFLMKIPFSIAMISVGVWQLGYSRSKTFLKILVAVFLLCPVTDMSATVAQIGMKFCMMVHIGPGCVFCPLEAVRTTMGTSKSPILG